ncbi:endonuclease dU [Sulfuracidifex tepidarius]|uniref:endonuclease dU n=1 Tax=Sulfuracidifex tepidarius TaxID=1294262 RepID=UPI0006D2B32B|nr:DUF99 family protein [Sulfuracidifex tepidarius]
MLVSGVDDGYFPLSYKRKSGKAPLVSVTFSNYAVQDVDFGFVTVDGEDATDVFNSLHKGEFTIIDSVICGGFNYIKAAENYIYFFGKKPNTEAIFNALKKNFGSDEMRIEVIMNVLKNITRIPTKKGTVYINTDLQLNVAKEIIEYYQVFVKYPEPIRHAHIIGRAIGQLHVNEL